MSAEKCASWTHLTGEHTHHCGLRGDSAHGEHRCDDCGKRWPWDDEIDAVVDADGNIVEQKPEPRTWSLPPEPGPEVKAVRDQTGDLHLRVPAGWVLRGSPMHKAGDGIAWVTMLARFGPLTDATEVAS